MQPVSGAHARHPLLYVACYGEQLAGGFAAEVRDGESVIQQRSAEGGIEGAILRTVDVDVLAAVAERVTQRLDSLHWAGGRCGGWQVVDVFDEGVVLLAIAQDGACEVLALGQSSRVAGDELERNARLCVGEELVETVILTIVHILGENLSYAARAILFFLPCHLV